MLDDAIPARDTTLLALLVVGMIAIAIATGALGVAQTLLSNTVGQRRRSRGIVALSRIPPR